MITPGCENRIVSTLRGKKRRVAQIIIAYLFDNFWKGSSLESNSGIPFSTQRIFHGSFKLGFARIRIRQIFHKVFSSLLIPFFRDDYMLFVKIGTRSGIYSGYFLDSLRFRREFSDSNTSP